MGNHKELISLTALAAFFSLSSILCEVTLQSTFYIGRVEKKQFYVFRDKQNWTQAKANCEKGKFKLATIRNDDELNFLAGKYEYAYFHGWHWIAARDSRDLTQFVWDDDHSQINISPTLINNGTFNSTTTFLTCGAFQINQVGSSVLMVDCSKNNGYALCELVEP